jgi:aminoglycoside phosphotransferase (APT) family kinase protein
MRFTRGTRSFVFRRPPPHKRANSDETMRREARVLAALKGSDVPHPALIAACPDESYLGAAFYLMEPIDGFNATLGLPEPHASDLAMQHRMGLAMPEAIAALGRVDYVACGLADLSRFEGWAERQVGRWRKQLDSYSDLPGYPGPEIPGVGDVGRWLDANRPLDVRAGLIHGDFHFANVLFRRDCGELAAVVDWELVTLGDPLLDLGHLLCTWPRKGVAGVVPMHAPGLPMPDEVIAQYAKRTTRDLSDVKWYWVLACYRLGLILEGTHARAFAGLAPKETGDRLHASTVGLFEQALELIG